MKNSFVVNGRFLSQKMTGVHRYAYEMCRALQRLGADFVIVAPKNVLPQYDLDGFTVEHCGRLFSHIWEQIELPLYIRQRHNGKILLSLTGLGSILYSKTICTVHDLSYLVNPSWFSRSYYMFYKLMTPLAVRRALKVITVSDFSKRELIDKLGVSADKITVVYNAVTAFPKTADRSPVDGQKYILSVSSLDPRKNLSRLIEAFSVLDNNRYKLYIVGAGNRVFADTRFEGMPNENIIFTGYVADEMLCHYYLGATIFVSPSLYEGFGLPNLEAMTNACPVVTSDIAPYREVCGDAAEYFDPESVEDMVSKISSILADPSKRDAMVAKGIERAQMFSWESSAEKLLQIIDFA